MSAKLNWIPFYADDGSENPLPAYYQNLAAKKLACNEDLIAHLHYHEAEKLASVQEAEALIADVSGTSSGDVAATELFGLEAETLSEAVGEVEADPAPEVEVDIDSVIASVEAEAGALATASANEQIRQYLAEFERDYFKLKIGSDLYVCRDFTDKDGIHNLDPLKKNAFFDGYTHMKVVKPVPNERPKTVYPAKDWFDQTARSYLGGMVFKPDNSHVAAGRYMEYNLWKGWSLEPIPFDDSVKLITDDYLRDVVCSGNKESANWLLDWLAHLIQKPWERPGTAVVLTGRKGNGKSTIIEILRMFARRYVFSTAKKKQIVGGFNGHMANCLVLVAEEAMLAGDGEADSVLKDLITAPTVSIEQKFKDAVMVDCYLRVFVFSNDPWVVAATDDERRFFVPTVSEHRRGDKLFFNKLYSYFKGDGAAQFLDFLMKRDISCFDPRIAPETKGLKEQREFGLAITYKLIIDAMHSGAFTNDVGGATEWPDGAECVITRRTFQELVLRAHLKTKYADAAPTTKAVGKMLCELGLATKRGDPGARVTVNGTQRDVYTFPTKRELADRMIKVLKLSPEEFEDIE